MSTRATIKFKDRNEEFFVYRHHDGFPENVIQDIKDVLKKVKDRWSAPECGTLVSVFIGTHHTNQIVPDYIMTTSFTGDESYTYLVKYDDSINEWKVEYFEA
jgi:hypothetical protein